MHYLIEFCSRPEATSDFISGTFVRTVVIDNFVKLGDPRLKRSREIPPEAVYGGIFDVFFAVTPNWNWLAMSYPVWL